MILSGVKVDHLSISFLWDNSCEQRHFELRMLNLDQDVIELRNNSLCHEGKFSIKTSKLLNIIQTIAQFCENVKIELDSSSVTFHGIESTICRTIIQLKSPEICIISSPNIQQSQTFSINQLMTISRGGLLLAENASISISSNKPLSLCFSHTYFGYIEYILAEKIID